MHPSPLGPLARLADLLVQCFRPDELKRTIARVFPDLEREMPVVDQSVATFAHEMVNLLNRHNLIVSSLFVQFVQARPQRGAQFEEIAELFGIDSGQIRELCIAHSLSRDRRDRGDSLDSRMGALNRENECLRDRLSLWKPLRAALQDELDALRSKLSNHMIWALLQRGFSDRRALADLRVQISDVTAQLTEIDQKILQLRERLDDNLEQLVRWTVGRSQRVAKTMSSRPADIGGPAGYIDPEDSGDSGVFPS